MHQTTVRTLMKSIFAITLLLIIGVGILNAQVTEEWVRLYNGPGDFVDYAHAQVLDAHGNVYITGYVDFFNVTHQSDFLTLAYDSMGNFIWEKRYSGPWIHSSDEAYAMSLDSTGNIYVTGTAEGLSEKYMATIKYDNTHSQ